MKNFAKFALVLFLLLFMSQKFAFAAAPDISSHPSNINLDEGFTIQASMSGLSASTIYKLRIVLAKSGTSNYFGSTYNGTDWYNGTPSPIDYSKFLSITTASDGSWSGDIMGKVESNDPNYDNIGPSDYDLKLGRYTQTGSTATWSTTVQTHLIATAPTSTPQPTPTPTKAPTPTKTPTSAPTKSPTLIPSKVIPTLKKSTTPTGSPTSVLGISTKSADKKPSPTPKTSHESSIASTLPLIAVIGGSILLLACAILVYFKIAKNNEQ